MMNMLSDMHVQTVTIMLLYGYIIYQKQIIKLIFICIMKMLSDMHVHVVIEILLNDYKIYQKQIIMERLIFIYIII